jgi:hypothetical protein
VTDKWQVAEGTGWISLPAFGRINPRRDNESGGRQYFTAMTDDGGFAQAYGSDVTGGPETWHFEFDRAFWLEGRSSSLEVEISLLEGGRYAVKFREGERPASAAGGW